MGRTRRVQVGGIIPPPYKREKPQTLPHKDLRLSRGGAKEIRTPDLCSAIAALYQLSYSPVSAKPNRMCRRHVPTKIRVGGKDGYPSRAKVSFIHISPRTPGRRRSEEETLLNNCRTARYLPQPYPRPNLSVFE